VAGIGSPPGRTDGSAPPLEQALICLLQNAIQAAKSESGYRTISIGY
jgi:C4-dicarboxylate-specific signal transduction histidine kinase